MNNTYTVEQINELLKIMRLIDVRSLNEPMKTSNNDEQNFSELGDFVEDRGPDPHELLENEERRKLLLSYVEKLRPAQAQIIKDRFGLEDGIFKTLEEVGKIHGVTRERIRQLEMKGLKRLHWLITVKGKCKNINDF